MRMMATFAFTTSHTTMARNTRTCPSRFSRSRSLDSRQSRARYPNPYTRPAAGTPNVRISAVTPPFKRIHRRYSNTYIFFSSPLASQTAKDCRLL